MTPNGVYAIDSNICISIGKYHPENYRAVLGVSGFTENIMSGMVGWKDLDGGIGLMNTTAGEKKKFAMDSRAYNAQHYSHIMAGFQ